MKINIVFILFILMSSNITGQTIKNHVEQISGEWSGKLTYTDFSDDIKQSTLKCQMNAEWKKNKLSLSIGFEEPNGKIFYDKTKIRIYNDEKRVEFDGVTYSIENFTLKESINSWTLILTSNGKDNRKPALIKQSIIMDGENLTFIKEIKYDGTKNFFTRNSYKFKRQ